MDSALPTPTHDADPSADDFSPPARAWWPLLLVALAALLLGGLAGYRLGHAAPPAADPVDVGLGRDQRVHHEQAGQLAAPARRRRDNTVARMPAS